MGLYNRVGKGMEIPGAHLTVVEVFDVDSKNRCTFAWKSRSRAKDQKEKMVVCAMILKVMASRGTVDSVELRRLSRDLLTKTKLCLQISRQKHREFDIDSIWRPSEVIWQFSFKNSNQSKTQT